MARHCFEGNETPDELAQIEKFLNIIDNEKFFQSIRQYVEALVNNQLQKEIIPAARILVKDMISKEKTTDELADLFENSIDVGENTFKATSFIKQSIKTILQSLGGTS